MTPLNLSDPIYHDEDKAREHIEAMRWPDGVMCPHCGGAGFIRMLKGKSMGPGWWWCGDCDDKFTVRVGTVFGRSHVPLHKWLLGFRLMASSKKGVSAHQLHRTLGVTYKTAWFMAHRIREAMADDGAPMGGDGKHIEADEAFFGNKPGHPVRRGTGHKRSIVALVERGGEARSFHVKAADTPTVTKILDQHADKASTLNTDEAASYRPVGTQFANHQMVNHGRKEYRRGTASTNDAEAFFSVFKRGMQGVYQHCGDQHLQRYLSEFSFRHSHRVALGVNDQERTTIALQGADGKRLTYRALVSAKASS